jgi:parallel beta-helix repeat protein
MRKFLGCFIILIIMITSQILAGTNYYVDATIGNDSNNGTSPTTPWKTISKVNSYSFSAGDVILFKRGQVWREELRTSSSEYLTYSAYGSGNNPVIDGANEQDFCFRCSKNHITVDSIDMKNSNSCCILAQNCNNLTVKNLTVSYAGTCGIWTEDTTGSILIDNVTALYNGNSGIRVCREKTGGTIKNCLVGYSGQSGAWGMGIDIDSSSNITVENNETHHSYGAGIGGDEFSYCTIQDNEVYANHWGGIDLTGQTSPCQNCIVRRNVIYNHTSLTWAGGIHIWTAATEGHESKNHDIYSNILYGNKLGIYIGGRATGNEIYNNTLYNNYRGILITYGETKTVYPSNNIIKNNIVHSNSQINLEAEKDEATNICNYNCYYPDSTSCFQWNNTYYNTFSGYQSASGQDANSLNSDPLFIDASNNDFSLKVGSLCIDAGINVGLKKDYHGTIIPQGYAPDIGAYEYEGTRSEPPVASFTAYPTQGASPLLVSFDASASYDPDGSLTSYKWEFGDGGTGSGVTTSHTYEKGGTFTAKLTVTDNANQSSSSTKTISAGSPPVASFVASPTAGRAPLTVNFDASSSYDPDGTIASYSWNFGDGSSGSGKIVSYTYTKEGTFTATLTVKDDISLEGKTSQEIKISSTNVIASFTTSTRKGEAPLSVTFDASGSKPSDDNGKITSYVWDFGDGTGDSGIKVSHTYAKTGKFIATLKVTDDKSKTDSTSAEISVYSKPKPLFTLSPISGVAPLPVTFDASSSYDSDGSIVSYVWLFGDGTTGSGQKVTHTYTKAGNFTVLLSVTDNEGYSDSLSKTIDVSPGTPPVASFVASPTAGRAPLAVNFDASASSDPDGTIASYSWSFGDGTSGTGKIVSHTYTREGTFTATLTVKDNGGLEAKTSQEIKISSTNAIASFTASARKGEAPLNVTFDASGSKPSDANGKITSYAWDFGDGTGDSGIKVSHTFARSGRFIATLKVTDDKTKTDSSSAEISIYSKPKALFSLSPISGVAPLLVTLDASSSYDADGRIISYVWSFGDGTTGSGQKVTHTYTRSGNFKVVLTVTDNEGYSDSLSKTIDVVDKPFPPLNVKVTKIIDKDRMRSEGGYIIEWSKNPLNEGKFNVVKYRIYRKKENQGNADFTLIAEVNSNIFVYEDSNLSTKENVKGYTYALSSLDDKGKESVLSSPVSSQNLNSIVYSEPNKNFKYGEGKPVKGSKGSY